MPNPSLQQLHLAAQQALNKQAFREAHQYCLAMLKLKPDHADAHFLLGMIAFSMQQMSKALGLIEHASKLAPANAEYYAQLARVQAMLNNSTAASATLEKAIALQPTDALTLDTIGVVYSRIGMHQQAAKYFQRCTALKPKNAGYWYNLAASLRFTGDFEQARDAYEKVISINPQLYAAHSSLADLGGIDASNNHIQRLERLMQQSKSIDGQVHLGHALLKEYEALADYEKAFKALSRGNQAKKKQLNYLIQHDQQLFDAMERAFADYQFDAAKGCSDDQPIFITGMPRSGTTLVDRIISSHSKVFTAGELQNFGVAMKRSANTTSKQVLDTETIAQAMNIDFAELGQTYINSTRPQTEGHRHFTDKMPLNFFYLGFIHSALPNAKLIYLRRNPMDTCLSNFRQLFALNFSYYNYSYDLLDTGRYYLMFDQLMKFWEKKLSDKLLCVDYEMLVAEPEQEIKRILTFCGLSFEKGCIDFHLNSAPVATASAVQVRQPMNSNSIGRWHRYKTQCEPLKALLQDAGLTIE
ncbi:MULTISPECIES: tetratricopeptide repeat-containing sulfotransferase family protein [Corallincola]|uniref:Sulfotransferase family protein n=2 Tax=Corallincola TaxID=1775176 RepID=A0A368NF56_9GAMM|nr:MULTISPECIES: tetratricopeptide repeat-containing sulfotransferase family protein [Corallincola]RCU48740.1 sulfotransferase family protein [Corallincola holothuriorum]TAA42637.1 sulfotransferase family protein [Corallincola spongiicola]